MADVDINASYFVKKKQKKPTDSTKQFFEIDIIKMLNFWLPTYLFCLVDVFSIDSRHSFSTNRASLFIDMFLYSHEADFIHGLLQKNEKKLAWSLISRSAI